MTIISLSVILITMSIVETDQNPEKKQQQRANQPPQLQELQLLKQQQLLQLLQQQQQLLLLLQQPPLQKNPWIVNSCVLAWTWTCLYLMSVVQIVFVHVMRSSGSPNTVVPRAVISAMQSRVVSPPAAASDNVAAQTLSPQQLPPAPPQLQQLMSATTFSLATAH